MQNTIIKGTGNSRYLKSNIDASATLEDIISLLRAGTFPIDLNGINLDGITQLGTPLDQATLLNAQVAALIGLTSEDPTVSEALEALYNRITATQEETTEIITSSGSWTAPDNLVGSAVSVVLVGGGGAGGGGSVRTSVSGIMTGKGAGGGGSGYVAENSAYQVTPGDVISVTVGTGGTAGSASSSGTTAGGTGGTGGTTIFGTISASGGEGGVGGLGGNAETTADYGLGGTGRVNGSDGTVSTTASVGGAGGAGYTINGVAYGGGGRGGQTTGTSPGQAGNAGRDGVCVLTYTVKKIKIDGVSVN